MEARGVISMELTIGSKSLATAFFIIEVVHADVSAYITLADAAVDWQRGSTQCLSGKDLTGYGFLSICKDGFVSVSVLPASGTWLGV
jgi:hypothetical protein